MDPQYLTLFDLSDFFCQEPVQNPGHKSLRQCYIRYIRDLADDTCVMSHP